MAGSAKKVTAKVGRKVTMFVCQIFTSKGLRWDMAPLNSRGEMILLAVKIPRQMHRENSA